MQNSLESNDRGKAPGQRKTFLRMSRRNLFFQLPGNRLCTEDFVGEFVDKCAECFGNGKCFFVVNREVDGTSVNSIVSVEAAQIGENQELRRKIQAAEFLGKSFSLCVSCVHHFFKTGAKEGASGARREIKNRLSLTKEILSFLGHVFVRLNIRSCRIASLASNVDNEASASCTSPQTGIFDVEKAAEVFGRSDFEMLIQYCKLILNEIPLDVSSPVERKDGVLSEISRQTAVRTNHRFSI